MNLKSYFANSWMVCNIFIAYRLIRGFARALLLGKNSLKTIELYPTFKCQSRCEMCSVVKFSKSDTEGQKLSLHDYECIAKEGSRNGAILLCILGGEPFLSEDLVGIIRIFKKRHYFVLIVSNAISLTREWVISLKKAGLNSIYFSLESLDPEENDRVRGYDGHHSKVMKAIDICKSEKMNVGLCAVLFPGKFERFKRIITYCRDNDLLASGGEIGAVGCAEKRPLVSKKEHNEVLKLLKDNRKLIFDWAWSYFLKYRCPAGKERLGITCYGDVVGCSMNPISFGNIKKESLRTIWKRMGNFSKFTKDTDRCVSACDSEYVKNYIEPLYKFSKNPVSYRDRPNMTKEKEPGLYVE